MQHTFSPPEQLPPPFYIDNEEGMSVLTKALTAEPAFAVDTESNSLFVYRERLCLIQFSTPASDYVLDPFAFSDLSALAPFFANPLQLKVFHAAEYDLACLKRDYRFEFAGIFDTMVAARTLGWPQAGLASILQARFGVKLNKKFQRANWGRRPLPPDQLEYARLDTHYLLGLYDLLQAELKALGCEEEAREECARLTRVKSETAGFDPDGFWRIIGSAELSPSEIAVLRELYVFREHQSERVDRPPFKVLGNQTLLEIAQQAPRRMQALNQVHGMTPGQIHRYGPGLLKAVQRGLQAPAPRRPHTERVPGTVRERYQRLHQWRKEKAKARGVESDVILPRDALWEIARQGSNTFSEPDEWEHFGPWRRQTYGPELIELLKSVPDQPANPRRRRRRRRPAESNHDT